MKDSIRVRVAPSNTPWGAIHATGTGCLRIAIVVDEMRHLLNSLIGSNVRAGELRYVSTGAVMVRGFAGDGMLGRAPARVMEPKT